MINNIDQVMGWKGNLNLDLYIRFCCKRELIHGINLLFPSYLKFLLAQMFWVVHTVFTCCFSCFVLLLIAMQPASVQQIPIPIYAPLQGQHQAQLSLGAGPAVSQAQELFGSSLQPYRWAVLRGVCVSGHRAVAEPPCLSLHDLSL